jgi:hypothetical protein
MPKESPRGVPFSMLAFLIATCRLGRKVPASQAAPRAGPRLSSRHVAGGRWLRWHLTNRGHRGGFFRNPLVGSPWSPLEPRRVTVASPVGYQGSSPVPACEFSGPARRL